MYNKHDSDSTRLPETPFRGRCEEIGHAAFDAAARRASQDRDPGPEGSQALTR